MNALGDRGNGTRRGRGSRLTSAFQLADIDQWRPADKSLLVSCFVAGLVLYAMVLLWYAAAHPAEVPFIDPATLSLQLHLTYGVLACWLVLGAVSAGCRGSQGQLAIWNHAPVQLFAITNSFFAYLMGPLTVPYGPVVLIGGILASLPLFGARSTLLGASSWLLVSVVLVGLEQSGVIPYGPLFRGFPVVDGQLSPYYLAGIGSITVVGVGLAAALSLTMIRQLQIRDADLVASRAQLLASVERVNQSNAEIARGHDELEARVEERTAELRTVNESLLGEVAERKRAAEELNRLRLAMEAAIEGVALVDADGRFEEVNGAFAEMHHCPPKAMIGTLADDWIDSRERWRAGAAVAALGRAEKQELTALGLRPDGTQFSLEIFLVDVAHESDGSHYRFARDITEQEALAAQVTHASKMEAIGGLVGGIAHDFNNLLTAILSASEQLQSRFEGPAGDPVGLDLVNTTLMAGTRAADLTRQLLDYAHLRPSRGDRIDIDLSVHNFVHLLESALDASIRIETELCDEPLLTRGDGARFDSGLLNLGLNARDAMVRGGALRISTRAVRRSPRDLGIADLSADPADFALIEVADSGEGIDPAHLSKIFDPFFTTKPAGKGTGLGLSVFDRHVTEIGGALQVESTPGVGTVCSVYVPLVAAEAFEDGWVAPDARIAGQGRLLVAEDEPAVLKVLTMTLEQAGYSVLACRDGGEAVETFRAEHEDLAAALLDFRMPVMNGAEVFREFQRVGPDVPVILMSGNLSEADVAGLKAEGLRAVVGKPYTRAVLLGVVREVLDEVAEPS